MQTLAQKRSAFALDGLRDLGLNADKMDNFATFTAGLPAMVLQNGFGLTLAFLLAKGKNEHMQAFLLIWEWLSDLGLLNATKKEEVLTSLAMMSQQDYLQAQAEALALLEWVKRYANAGLFTG